MEHPFSLAAFKTILIEAGGIVRRWYNTQTEVVIKGDGSPLTQADTEANAFLHAELGKLFPQAKWLSEESADDLSRLDAEWLWVVDPVDGTKEFVNRIPELAVSVGLVRHGRVFLGGVLNPIANEGGVGFVSGENEFWGFAPSVAPAAELAKATVSLSRTEVKRGDILECVKTLGQARPVGSVAYKLLRVAAGVDDLTLSIQPKSEWDICGGVALLQSAKKKYIRLDGVETLFNQRDILITAGAVAGPEPLASAYCAFLGTNFPQFSGNLASGQRRG